MKLSRPAWNNILILASVIMILAFNGVHKKLLSNAEESREHVSIIPEQSMLLTLDFGQFQIERVGKGWRSVGAQLSNSQLQRTIKFWQALKGSLLEEQQNAASQSSLNQSPILVTLWLAGEEDGLAIELYQHGQNLLIRKQQQLVEITDLQIEELIPNA